ncbi:MAG: gamma carbonic anhydrase family protein [Cyclobacteriaceae bacterium]
MAHIITVRGFSPQFGKECFIAENATVVGQVTLGDYCSVWFNAVVRGDVNEIRVGQHSNIQDGAVIHCTYEKAATHIGNYVTIGHQATVHGCTLQDRCMIGMGAIVMDYAVVETGSIVAAGSVVLENTIVEANSIYAGIPAKKVKTISAENKEMMERIARNYIKYAGWYKEQD